MEWTSTAYTIPVSYTHLDVYKRQAYICAIIGGIANSFLDTGIYPAVSEIIYKAPGVATMGIKFFIAIAQMLLPFVLGMTRLLYTSRRV